MKTYRSVWLLLVTVVSALGFATATAVTGWLAAVVVAVSMTSVGAMFGAVWYEDARARRRSTVRFALWAGLSGVVMLGYTPVLHQWSALLLLAVVVSAPDVVEWCQTVWALHQQSPALTDLSDLSDLTYRALERRWRTTTWQVRSCSLEVQDRLQLVIQREWLLEELERRDPARFEGSLVRDGWREPQQT